MPQATLTTRFSVIGSNTVKRLFPKEYPLPRPGQWIFVSSVRQGISTFLAQITNVTISTLNGIPDLYEVRVELNRVAPKEEILFARLARRQFDLIEREGEALEPLNLTETLIKLEALILNPPDTLAFLLERELFRMGVFRTMRIKDNTSHSGELNAYLIRPDWRLPFPTRWPQEDWPVIRHLFQKKNQITTAGQLYSYAHGFNFSWIAGGTGTNTPTPSDLFLQSEQQRFEVIDLIFTAGEIKAFAEIPPGTGNLTWREWGVFLDDAALTAGSGTLYSRLLQTFTKNLGDSVLLTYTLTETI